MSEAHTFQEDPEERDAHPVVFCVIAVFVGVVTGLGAILFHYLIAFFHNLFFYGRLSLTPAGETLLEPSIWGPFIILVPVIGGLGVVWLTRTFAPEARGSGVPEVIDAIYFREGLIRPVVAAAKSLATALSIGSGASVGREGPIIQIGASLASTLARLIHLSTWQRITLIAAGAGGGIAATFNTPLGGVMFAIELMLPELSSRTFLPVVLSTATASYIGRLVLGMSPAFVIPAPEAVSAGSLELFNVLAMGGFGVLCGLASWAFIRLQSSTEIGFERLTPNPYLRHAAGMLGVGLMLFGLQSLYGHYHIAGASYATISEILHGNLVALQLLVVLFLAKLGATALSLGTGASGGIFSPVLFLGATLGAAFGTALSLVWPGADINPMNYAVVGMAALVGGTTGAAMTAIVMVFEMTRDYVIIIPLIIAVALSIGLRRTLINETIYTIKLTRRGRSFSSERHRNLFLMRRAEEFTEEGIATLPEATTVSGAFGLLGREADVQYLLLTDGNDEVSGILSFEGLLAAEHEDHEDWPLARLGHRRFVQVGAGDLLSQVVQQLTHQGVDYALVYAGAAETGLAEEVVGVLDKDHLADSVMEQFRSFSTGP
ncbi:MAG: chloride channel protein [Halospina sp.]